MTEPLRSIVETIDIEATPESVWTYLVEPEHVSVWLGCLRYEKRVGHVFYMQSEAAKRREDDVSGATHCEVLELSEPSRFMFSWYVPDTPETTVTIDLAPRGAGGTRVTLEHAGWDRFEPDAILQIRNALEGGWRSYVLPGLKATVEAA
jgi:uncharacterized protein YndB with AHSA1/START domain